MTIINMDMYRTQGVTVFSGRERGTLVRDAARLNERDRDHYVYEIHVPEDVVCIASGFFLNMFGPSIRDLGEEHFRRKYVFTGADMSRAIDKAIRVIQNAEMQRELDFAKELFDRENK